MEQTEIKLHILYFLVAVIVTCETRFRHLGQTYNTRGGYGDQLKKKQQTSDSLRENSYKVRYRKNIPINGLPINGRYLSGRYTNKIPVNTGRLVGDRGFQAEISPYSSKQVPPGRFINTSPPGYTKTVNNNGGSMTYDKSLFVSPGVGFKNTKIPEKVHIDPRYPLYDGYQVFHPYDDQNLMNVSPLHRKFKSPSSGKVKNIHPTPYGGTSGWNINRHAANKERSLAYDGYLGVRSFRNNPTVNEKEDLTVQDSGGVPTDSSVVKKRIMPE